VLFKEAKKQERGHSLGVGASLIEETIFVFGTFWKFAGSIPLTALFGVLVVLSALSLERVDTSAVDPRALFSSLERPRWRVGLDDVDETVLLLTWLLVPVACMFLVSYFTSRFYAFRYLLGSSGALYLLVARGFTRLDGSQVRRLVGAALVILLAVNLVGFYTVDDSEQWDEAANFVEARAEGGELLLFNMGDNGTRGSFSFYFERDDIEMASFPSRESRAVTTDNIDRLPKVVAGHDGVWLILSHSQDCRGRLVKRLDDRYTLTAYRSFVKIQVYHFEKGGTDIRPEEPAPPPSDSVLSCG
jgi:hypothetical protein